MKRRTHDEFISVLKERNQNVEVVSKYISSKEKVKVRCLKCDHEWYASPSNLLKGFGCPECARKALTKTHDEFVKQMNGINPNIEVIGRYINDNVKIDIRCKICGHEWKAKPSNLIQRFGCPNCYKLSRFNTHEYFISRIKNINPNIEILSEYKGANKKVKCKCNKCCNIWETKASSLLSGHGCPICFHNSKRKTHEQFVEEVKNINSDITIIGNYKNSKTKIKCRCNNCGHIWMPYANGLLVGRGCPRCKKSEGEKAILSYLDSNNIFYLQQYIFIDCRDINPLPFDFYLPNNNLLIEFDGEQHFRPVDYFGGIEKYNTQVKHDEIKNQYCFENNLRLLRIPYTEFNNINHILDIELSA